MARRILLVDDDATVRLTLKAVLEWNGFAVTTAASVSEAQMKLTAGVYELIITEARMEGADLQVIEVARQQAYRPATALLTAFLPDSIGWKKRKTDSVLVKPIGTRELLHQLEDVLIRHQEKLARQTSQKVEPKPIATAPRTALGSGPHRKIG